MQTAMLPFSEPKGSCRPCRESKALCDKKKPRCSECVSSNKLCGGYDLGNIFININSTGPPPLWNRSRNAQKYLVLDLASQPLSRSPSPSPSGTHLIKPASAHMTLEPGVVANLPLPDPQNLAGMVELFLDVYYRRFGPDKTSSEPLQPGNEFSGWRTRLPQWLGQSPVLDCAIGAMTTAFIGAQYQDSKLIIRARDTYLSGLQMLQVALSEPGSAQRTDLLATTLVMGSIEAFTSSGGGLSQLTHFEGATRLLQCAFEAQGRLEELHLYALSQGLCESMAARRRYEFSSPSFQYSLRECRTSLPDDCNTVFFQWCETALPLPNLLAAADSLVGTRVVSSPTPPTTISGVLDDLAMVEQQLAVWHEFLKASMPGPWAVPAAEVSAESVPFPLQFINIEACTLYCLHWLSQLLILEARQCLIARLPLASATNYPAPESAAIAEFASLICRSVQYCTQDRSFAATENMFFPLFVVASYYQRNGDMDRMNWCIDAFARVAADHKIGFAQERLDLLQRTLRSDLRAEGTPENFS